MEFSEIAQEMNRRIEDGEEITVDLDLDDGRAVTCTTMIILTVDAIDYIVLLPLDENGQNPGGDVWFYRYTTGNDEEPELGYISKDEELEKVSKAFDEYLEEAQFDELICDFEDDAIEDDSEDDKK